jgi:beta-glucosidase
MRECTAPNLVARGKTMKITITGRLTSLLLLFAISPLFAQYQYPFQNPNLPAEERITNILALMTLDEKIAALRTSTAVPRLGIPDAGASEGLHGLVQRALGGFGSRTVIPTTQFAQVVGMGQTWDVDLIRRAGEIQGIEARWIYNHKDKYNRAPLVVWGPNSDLARDPRWGRIDESYGEDAFFTGTMSAAFVKGMQGNDPKYWRAASLLKHFLANSNEHGRYGSSSDFDERLFHEYYSVPFRMAFLQGGASSYMASYNAWNSVPMTVHSILKTILADEWKVDGIVSTDAGAVRNMVTKHRYYPGMKEAVAACLKVGVNQFLDGYQEGLQEALKANLATERDIDAALRGKYRVVLRLGLLDPPDQVPYAKPSPAEEPWTTETHKEVARQVARESIVLLKNSGNLLPLNRSAIKSIAVYGPRANAVQLGLYSGEPPYRISPIEGLRKKVGEAVKINMGFGFMTDPAAAAKSSDVAIVFVGNDATCNRLSIISNFGSDDSWCETPSDGMENSDRRSLNLEQEQLIQEVYAANPRTIVVLLADFPYAINWTQERVPAILTMSQNAQEAGTAMADVLFGDYNPGGRLVVTWPKSLDQLPPMMDYNIRHGHTYMYFRGEPLYPFGYGLSYTTFAYSNLQTSSPRMSHSGEVTVSVDVKNTGSRAGDEVVQLYVRHETSQVMRPRKELRGFARVTLQPNETKTVQMRLAAQSLSYWDEKTSRFVVEDERVRLIVGGSSADAKTETTINIVP